MPDPPRRRRSSSSPQPPSRGSGGMFGTIALSLGVIIAGLGIGALISAFQTRNQTAIGGATPVPAVTPVVMETRPPVALFTPIPRVSALATESPSPQPTESPSPSAVPTHGPSSSPRASTPPTGLPTTAASAAPRAIPAASTLPSPVATTIETAAPRSTERATPPPPPVVHPATAAVASVAAPPPAQTLVRRYVNALIAGDERTAYAALGGSAGDGGLTLKEEAFIDRETRITSVRSSRTDPATVEVEITSSRGTYYATYHVAQGASGAFIDQHDYIKV